MKNSDLDTVPAISRVLFFRAEVALFSSFTAWNSSCFASHGEAFTLKEVSKRLLKLPS